MADKKLPKFFLTSDKKFLINPDKIAFIESSSVSPEPYILSYTENNDSNTGIKRYHACVYTYSNGITKLLSHEETDTNSYAIPLYHNYNFVHGTYFNVYIEGCESPIKLKYADGIVLMNFMASDACGGIFVNTIGGTFTNMIYSTSENGTSTMRYSEISDVVVDKENNITYSCKQATIPQSFINSKTCFTNINDLTFQGSDLKTLYNSTISPYTTVAALENKLR